MERWTRFLPRWSASVRHGAELFQTVRFLADLVLLAVGAYQLAGEAATAVPGPPAGGGAVLVTGVPPTTSRPSSGPLRPSGGSSRRGPWMRRTSGHSAPSCGRRATGSGAAPAPPQPSSERSAPDARLPSNHKYTETVFTEVDLPPQIRERYPRGVTFTPEGHPDFGPYEKGRVVLDNLTGNEGRDEQLANRAIGFKTTPEGYVWHHRADGRSMTLIPKDLHDAVPHTGGAAILRATKGLKLP